jgi:hypothetical protein
MVVGGQLLGNIVLRLLQLIMMLLLLGRGTDKRASVGVGGWSFVTR